MNIKIIDQKIINLNSDRGINLMSAPDAYEKYSWTHKYFKTKPSLGYFIWIKKSQKKPLSSCISLEAVNSNQKLNNLTVVEPNVKAKLNALCNTLNPQTTGTHQGTSTIILKQSSSLKINHQHKWGNKNLVLPQVNFKLHPSSSLSFVYKNITSPKRLKITSKFDLAKSAKAESKIIIQSKSGQVNIDESLHLNGKDSSGTMVLKLLGDKKAKIKAKSKIIANSPGKGHLDCQGLLIGDDAQIDLIPQLVNKNKNALLTHEASIGRIEKQKLQYLQTRGFSQKQAIDLIVKGFLNL